MNLLKNKKFQISISIIFLITSVIHFIMTRGYLSLLSWGLLLVSTTLIIFLLKQVNEKNHFRILISIVAYFLIYSLLILQSFIEFPIPFNNTEYIIFTISFNLVWLFLYIFVMYHKRNSDMKYIFYIVTVVLVMFKTFTQSIRTVTFIRGYLTNALSFFGEISTIFVVVILVVTFYLIMFMYLIKTAEEMDLKSLKIRKTPSK